MKSRWEAIKESAVIGAAAVLTAFIFWFLLVVVFLLA
jgi:hypothetical protein